MNLKTTIATAFTVIILSFSVHAQSLVLCESYDTQGAATGVYTSWDIKPAGSYIYMLYNQSTNFRSGVYYIYIDKYYESSSSYGAYQTIEMKPESSQNWVALDQFFTEAGEFSASFMFNGTAMATTSFDIDLVADSSTVASNTDIGIDTYYYEDSDVDFGTSVDDLGVLQGEAETFSLGDAGIVSIRTLVNNFGIPFKTNLMYVDVYKEGSETVIDGFDIACEQDWDFVHFSIDFKDPGVYYVDIYNGDDIFINTGTVTIER